MEVMVVVFIVGMALAFGGGYFLNKKAEESKDDDYSDLGHMIN